MLAGVFRTIQIGLLVLCAYFVYGVVAPLVTSAALPEQRVPAVAPSADATLALDQYGAITERRLFRTRVPTKPVEPVKPVVKTLVETKLPLKLTATVASPDVPELSIATVMNKRTQETVVVRVNTKVASATVESIERGRIVIRNAGKLETLTLADDDGDKDRPRVGGANRGAKARKGRAKRGGADALRAANLRRARAKAAERARQQAGVEQPDVQQPDVAAVVPRPGTLRETEQVLSINGIPVDDPARMDELLATMNSGETVMQVQDEDGTVREVQLGPDGEAP